MLAPAFSPCPMKLDQKEMQLTPVSPVDLLTMNISGGALTFQLELSLLPKLKFVLRTFS